MNWENFKPSRATNVCIVLVIVSFLCLSFRLTQFVDTLRSFLYYWASPLPEIPFMMMEKSGGLGRRLSEMVFAHYENELLKAKVNEALVTEYRLQEIEAENRRLRMLLEFPVLENFKSLRAEVVALDPENSFQTVLINRGSDDGLEADAPVIALQGDPVDDLVVRSGLFGRVLEVAEETSKVLLISDPLSSISVALRRNGEQALLQGQGQFRVTLEYLNQVADIQPEDEIITSGLGGIFPPGLLVGKVEEVLGTTGGFKRAKVKPAINLTQARSLMVLTSPDLPTSEHPL
jgi:rod shape-determining protein MreC